MSEEKQIHVALPLGVHTRLKAVCRQRGVSVKEFVTKAIEKHFDAPVEMTGRANDRYGPRK